MLTKKQISDIEKAMKERNLNKTTLAKALGYKSRTAVTNVLNQKASSETVEQKILNYLEVK